MMPLQPFFFQDAVIVQHTTSMDFKNKNQVHKCREVSKLYIQVKKYEYIQTSFEA